MQNELQQIPSLRIPRSPILTTNSFGTSHGRNVPSVIEIRNILPVTSGRVAIAMALKDAQIGKGHKVLIPAYHCTAMVEPVLWSSATPIFYRIKHDTSIDIEDAISKVDQDVRAIIIVHYFGFPQDVVTIRQMCDKCGITLIEDCCHSFFGGQAKTPIGWFADYAIASPWKFFPIFDGGYLLSSRHKLDHINLRTPSVYFQIKAFFNILERAVEYQGFGAITPLVGFPLKIKQFVWDTIKSLNVSSTESSMRKISADDGIEFDPRWIDIKMSIVSRIIMNMASLGKIIEQRCANYSALREILNDAPGATTILPNLADNIVPHVFPLLVDDADKVFRHLICLGVPIIRFGEFLWAGMDRNTCKVASRYSSHLLQFPCHQGLNSKDIVWLGQTIRKALQ